MSQSKRVNESNLEVVKVYNKLKKQFGFAVMDGDYEIEFFTTAQEAAQFLAQLRSHVR